MNLSKLLDAAAYAQVRRSGWMHRPVVTRATMAQELDLGIERLRALDADGDLVAALELGSAKLARVRGAFSTSATPAQMMALAAYEHESVLGVDPPHERAPLKSAAKT